MKQDFKKENSRLGSRLENKDEMKPLERELDYNFIFISVR